MDHRTSIVCCVLAFFILLSNEGALGSQRIEDFLMLINDHPLEAFTETEYGMVKQLWTACKQDPIDLDLSHSSNANLQNAINRLPPQMKHVVLDCLMKVTSLHSVSGKDDRSSNWYVEQLEYLLGWRTESRRCLDDATGTNMAVSLAGLVHPPVPAPSPFFQRKPASAPATEPASAPATVHQAPASAPTQHSSSSPDQFVAFSGPPTSSANTRGSPAFAPSMQSQNRANTKRIIAVAVVVTAACTFVFAGLLFYVYHKCWTNGTNSGNWQKDDKPLLALSMRDFSFGSPPKSQVRDDPVADASYAGLDNGIFGTCSFAPNPSRNKQATEVGISQPDRQNLHPASIQINSASVESEKTMPSTPPVGGLSSTASLPTMPPRTQPIPPSPHPPPPTPLPPAAPPPPPPPPRPPAGPPPPPPHPTHRPSGQTSSPPLPPAGPSPPPPVPVGGKPGPRPPPPANRALPPPRPPPSNMISSMISRPPLKPSNQGTSVPGSKPSDTDESEAPKAKLKPFFWDKVQANPSHSMVWHQIKEGSFQFSEEMIESLFGYSSANNQKNDPKKDSLHDAPAQQYRILDPKKSQNLSILLRALNVTVEEVCDALLEGNELSVELIQTLLKMEPTSEEDSKLRAYTGELSQLGPAERFLKALMDIPFAFKRIDALFFMAILGEEMTNVKASFMTLEAACKELKGSHLFMKLLEAVLKTGNRMNDGTFRGGAQAFKLDTLLKLSDVKGADGKTTLLHFVVQEIIRSEGVRAARATRGSESIPILNCEENLEETALKTGDHYRSLGLQVVSGLGGELENVKKAAAIDADMLTSTVSKLSGMLLKTKKFLNSDMQGVEENGNFLHTLIGFVAHSEKELAWLRNEEKRIMLLVKGTIDYFHGNAVKDEGLRLFVIVRDFLCMLDKACKEVRETPRRMTQGSRTKESQDVTAPSPKHLLFPAILDRRVDSSDDDESPSP